MIDSSQAGPPARPPDPRAGGTLILRSGAQAAPVFAWLVEVRGKRAGQLHRLGGGTTMIGRAGTGSPVAIALDDANVSALHAEVAAMPDAGSGLRFSINDRGSTNGTHVNGERVSAQALVDNDQIELGSTTLIFKQL